MLLSIVVAFSENRTIGKNNTLPWHLPADLQHFKKVTMGKPIIMGRKTYESIGRALPGRQNIIISRNPHFKADNCVTVSSIADALSHVAEQEEAMIIGGAELFKQTFSMVKRLYLTIIHHQIEGDTFFPEFEKKEWQEIDRIDHQPDAKNAFSYSFITLERL